MLTHCHLRQFSGKSKPVIILWLIENSLIRYNFYSVVQASKLSAHLDLLYTLELFLDLSVKLKMCEITEAV